MRKAFEKQIKIIEDQGEKQTDTLKDLKQKAITYDDDDDDDDDDESLEQKKNFIINYLTRNLMKYKS